MGFQQTPNEPPRGPGGGGVAPLRIGRGAEVLCTDGTFGTVQQVIMDPTTSELQAIVVQPLGSREEVVIGIAHVERAGNNQVHLNVRRQTLRENPTIARPYNASRYVPVSPEAALPPEQAAGIASAADQPVVTGLERNAVDVIAPAHEVQSGVQSGVQPGVRGRPRASGSPPTGTRLATLLRSRRSRWAQRRQRRPFSKRARHRLAHMRPRADPRSRRGHR